MIRKIAFPNKPRIPAYLREKAKNITSNHFVQVHLDDPIISIAKQIPYPHERQRHSMVVLGNGGVETHTDDLSGYLDTNFCIPFHLPRGAAFSQNYDSVIMETGKCYSFNHREDHSVQIPNSSYTYSAFIIVAILTPRGLQDEHWREEMARKQQWY